MTKAEAQHSQAHTPDMAQRKRGAAGESPQGTQTARLAAMINASHYVAAQRKKYASLFGGAAQLEAAPAQRAMDEEPLQGKFDAVQRVGEEELLQGKFAAVQRVEDEEPLQGKFEPGQRVAEEEPLQGKFTPQTPAQLKEEYTAKPNDTGLPDNLKSGIESLSGISMDSVRVHYNSSQPAQLKALAYAQGTDIHVAPRQEEHLPHEAWHIVQQAQGRVRPTMQMKGGVPVNDDRGLEREADVMGARALGAEVRQPTTDLREFGPGVATAQPLQRFVSNGGVLQRTDPKMIRGRWVSGEELDREDLSSRYYTTWGFVESLSDRAYSYPKMEPAPAWLAAWNAYDAAFTAATQRWIAGGRQDFSEFAKGTALWTDESEVVAQGGLLTQNQRGPGPIPMVQHPYELVIDQFITRAHAAYANWCLNPIFAGRGPFDGQGLTRAHATMLDKRPKRQLGNGWTSQPSESGIWALHHPGPSGAEIDPRTGQPATFIYHF